MGLILAEASGAGTPREGAELPPEPVTTVTVFPAAPAGLKAGTSAVPSTAARLAMPTVKPRHRAVRARGCFAGALVATSSLRITLSS